MVTKFLYERFPNSDEEYNEYYIIFDIDYERKYKIHLRTLEDTISLYDITNTTEDILLKNFKATDEKLLKFLVEAIDINTDDRFFIWENLRAFKKYFGVDDLGGDTI